MARQKGGHVRGGVVPAAGGIITIGAYSAAAFNAAPLICTCSLTNPGSVDVVWWVYISTNGAPYIRYTLTQVPGTGLASQAIGPNLVTGQVIRSFVEAHDTKGELFARSNVDTHTTV